MRRWARLTNVSRIAGAQMSRPRPHATTQRTAGALFGCAAAAVGVAAAAAAESVRARLMQAAGGRGHRRAGRAKPRH